MLLSSVRRNIAEASIRSVVYCRFYSTPASSNNNSNSNDSVSTSPKTHWFYATDVPISKSNYKRWRPTSAAEKFAPFPLSDSARLEAAFQKVSKSDKNKDNSHPSVISVLDDKLYEVNVSKRTLYPIYWAGPTFEVRRGTWFLRDGSKNDPLPEPLAQEIETLFNNRSTKKGLSAIKAAEEAGNLDAESSKLKELVDKNNSNLFALTTPVHKSNVVKALTELYYPDFKKAIQSSEKSKKQPFISFNLDSEEKPESAKEVSAHVISGDVTSLLARKFVSIGGNKVVRGYDASKNLAEAATETFKNLLAENDTDEESSESLSSAAVDGYVKIPPAQIDQSGKATVDPLVSVSPTQAQERNVDHLVICIHGIGQKLGERLEQVNFVNDVNVFRQLLKDVFLESSDLQKSAAEYILTKYGTDVKTMQETWSKEKETTSKVKDTKKGGSLAQALESAKALLSIDNPENDKKADTPNSTSGVVEKVAKEVKRATTVADHRIQVIPLIWRHNVEFGLTRQDIDEHQEKEADAKSDSNKGLPRQKDYLGPTNQVSLEDINVNGILPLRNIVGDVILDVLLYYQPQYHQQIFESVTKQLNSIYQEFCKRNPGFAKNPQVSIIGHSLGSAIAFDIVCAQGQNKHSAALDNKPKEEEEKEKDPTKLDFDVDIFFGVGSPVGMFQLIKGNHIVPAEDFTTVMKDQRSKPIDSQSNSSHISKFFPSHLKSFSSRNNSESSSSENPSVVGYVTPDVLAYYNIFHPSDPVAYRVDPLVHRDAASLPARKVPYASGSFPSQIEKLSQFAFKFSKDWASTWTNAANSILESSSGPSSISKMLTLGRDGSREKDKEGYRSKKEGKKGEKEDSEKSSTDSSQAVSDRVPFDTLPEEIQAQVREKLSKINPTGQIDYALQEGVLDISLFAAIASHISYFENADMASFVLKSIYETRKGKSQESKE